MRIRTIKPEFWTHPVMGRLSSDAKVIAIGLLNMADDEGYFVADPGVVKGAIVPYDIPGSLPECSMNVPGILQELSKKGWIRICQHPEQGDIGQVVNFQKHQSISHPKASKLKVYASFQESYGNVPGSIQESSGNIPVSLQSGTGNRDQGMEQGSGKYICREPSSTAQRLAAKGSPKLSFDFEKGEFQNIPEILRGKWGQAYPAVNLDQELANAAAWLIANPSHKKSNYAKFLTNWLSKAQDRAPRNMLSLGTMKLVKPFDARDPSTWKKPGIATSRGEVLSL